MASRSRADASSPKAPDPALPHQRQARRRLIGAAALALVVGVLFALFFDAEPRGVRDDVQVRIPSRDTAATGPVNSSGGSPQATPSVSASDPAPTEPPAGGAAQAQAVGQAAQSGDARGGDARGESAVEPPPAGQVVAEPAPPAVVQAPKAEATAAKADAGTRPATKAARGEGKSEGKAGGYYLQVGAFASEKAASDQVERIRRLGATAFTESIRTQQGERIRVRLGPYPSREATDPVRNRLRAAGIDVTLVTP
jgi:DedD protein